MGDIVDNITSGDIGFEDIGGALFDPGNLLGLREGAGEKAARANQAYFERNVKVPKVPRLELVKHLQNLSPTELQQIQENPQLLQAQMGALGKLEEITAGGGLSAADRGRIGQIGREEAIAERGQRQALMQNAQARGLGGSGLEMASLLGAQQGSANRQANRDIDVENLAQQRALQAIQAQGNLSGFIRGQDYDKASQAALAQDAINRFNTGARNAAMTAQRTYNVGIPQQQFQNQLTYAQGRAGLNSALGAQTDQRYGALRDTLGSAAQVIGSIYGGPAGAAAGSAVKGGIAKRPEDLYGTVGV